MFVYVHRNLNKPGFWSIKIREDNDSPKLIGHARWVKLKGVVPFVYQSGRNRVVREGQKNVHAFLCGMMVGVHRFISKSGVDHLYTEALYPGRWTPNLMPPGEHHMRITYDPYQHDCFVSKENSKLAFIGSTEAIFDGLSSVSVLQPTWRKLDE